MVGNHLDYSFRVIGRDLQREKRYERNVMYIKHQMGIPYSLVPQSHKARLCAISELAAFMV